MAFVQINSPVQNSVRTLLNSSSYTRFDNNSSVNVRWQDVAMPAQLLARRGWHINRRLPTFLVISGPLGRFLKEQDSPLNAILRNDYAKYPTLAQARDVFNHDIFRRLRNGVGHWSFLWQENNGVQQLVMVDWETGVTDITITLLEAEAFHLVAFSGSIGSAMLM